MAFVPSVTTSSFTGSSSVNGQWTSSTSSLKRSSSTPSFNTVRMSFYSPLDGLLDKYDKISTREAKPEPPLPLDKRVPSVQFYSPLDSLLTKYDKLAKEPGAFLPPSKPSSVWKSFVSYTLKNDVLPSYVKSDFSVDFQTYMYGIISLARPSFAPGGKPRVTLADNYMSKCVTQQYKQMACTTGVYDVTCTEGAVSQQAEQSRVMALGNAFRTEQRSTAGHFGLMYENRKRAIMLSHGCSYEENLYAKLPKTSGVAVRASAEAVGSCSRAAISDNTAEKYMMASVERQCKQMAVATGVYSTACGDGAVKGLSEEKRVIGLAAKFRAGQLPLGVKLARDYNRRKVARDMYAHECSYEEALFNKYPAMAASMSGMGSLY